jgi:hypothetical protein
MLLAESPPGQRGIHAGMYRCIAYRRTGGCVTVVVNGQRYSALSDLLQLEGLLGATDISYMVFLRPSEAGTIYGEETTNGGAGHRAEGGALRRRLALAPYTPVRVHRVLVGSHSSGRTGRMKVSTVRYNTLENG